LIIEKASGMTYAEYVKKNLFDKAGMADSRYCSENAIVKRRAHGYDFGQAGMVRTAYLDHTWQGNTLLTPASYRELITPGLTNDGARLRYGKGIGVDSILGKMAYAHGGGINGFLSHLEYYPADSLTVVVLVNSSRTRHFRNDLREMDAEGRGVHGHGR
jgi:CubicO group peptidase (beta-lactamase class C family)